MKTILIGVLFFLSFELFAQSDSIYLNVDSSVLTKHHKIIYEFDKAVLRPECFPALDSIATYLLQNPSINIEIQNHSDGREREYYSINMTQRRAEKVRDYLIAKGVGANRLTAKGYGDTKAFMRSSEIEKLKTAEEKEEAYQKNRRTEFVVLNSFATKND